MALISQVLQHGRIGAPGAGLHPLAAGNPHFVEQHFTQLLGACHVEGMASELMDLRFHARHALGKVAGHPPQIRLIHLDAGAFHFQQHRDQPAFHLLIQRQRFRLT